MGGPVAWKDSQKIWHDPLPNFDAFNQEPLESYDERKATQQRNGENYIAYDIESKLGGLEAKYEGGFAPEVGSDKVRFPQFQ